MKPFFPYIGSKWTLAPKYGAPQYGTTIEPFAGSAAYSVRHNVKRAILFDTNDKICELWRYLIQASSDDILNLPVEFDEVYPLDIPNGAKHLIGFWISKGGGEPKNKRSAWGRKYANTGDCKVWGDAAKRRIASQVEFIRGWQVYNMNYWSAPNMEATWFIDPPYQVRGRKCYPNWQMDYQQCADFVRSRRGQVIVCEGAGADWLPFTHFADARGTLGKHRSGVSPEYAFFSNSLAEMG